MNGERPHHHSCPTSDPPCVTPSSAPGKRSRRYALWIVRLFALWLLFFALPLGYSVATHFADGERPNDWRTARSDSTGLAPDPMFHDEAIIQVYAARAFRWRGGFGVHAWIAAKPAGADHYTRFEVMGFNLLRGGGGNAVRVARGIPDAYWYGSPPELLREIRGEAEVDALIARLHQASDDYPYSDRYRLWPGPNSNTYIAHLTRAVPELRVDLPPTAIGKDYLPPGQMVSRPPSGRGVQFSLGGLLGMIASPVEGLELNILGLSAGFALMPPALKLPGIGRIGWPTEPAPDPVLPVPDIQGGTPPTF